MSDQDSYHQISNKRYFKTWLWLLCMTMLALGVGYTHMPEGLKGFLLVSITLAKIYLIASIFMHLSSEKADLVLMTFSPLILAMILFFVTYGESIGSATHVIVNR